jgi:di/tricarboxylate transporter
VTKSLALLCHQQAAMAAIAALLITGAIEARKAVSYVDWGLLLLIGSAIGLSQAMSNSGLARYIGESHVLMTLALAQLLLERCIAACAMYWSHRCTITATAAATATVVAPASLPQHDSDDTAPYHWHHHALQQLHYAVS